MGRANICSRLDFARLFRWGRLSAVPQDRAAAVEVLCLLLVVFGTAQVDEVEVDVAYVGTAQIRAAQVGLTNLLGSLELLFKILVGVEPHASSLRCNRAIHLAAA